LQTGSNFARRLRRELVDAERVTFQIDAVALLELAGDTLGQAAEE
jgi:hypothetical protein